MINKLLFLLSTQTLLTKESIMVNKDDVMTTDILGIENPDAVDIFEDDQSYCQMLCMRN
jgi:hypothetical protein